MPRVPAENASRTAGKPVRSQPEKQTATPQTLARQAPAPQSKAPAAIEKAKAEARTMLAGLAKLGAACAPGNGMRAVHLHPDPGGQITASITAALAEMKNPRPGQIPPR
jgi:hypothetical protein